MSTIVKKWGNSLGVRIPKQIADALHISSGTEVDIEVRKQEIIIKNHHSGLDELLEQITPSNLHKKIFSDDDKQGNEIW